MSEKRKPILTILLKKQGKPTNKIEVFSERCWPKKGYTRNGYWRIRVNGAWWPKNEFKLITKTQLKELMFKAISHAN